MSNLEIYKKYLLGTTFKTLVMDAYVFEFGYIVDEHHVFINKYTDADIYSLSDVFYKIDTNSWILEKVVERKLKLIQINDRRRKI